MYIWAAMSCVHADSTPENCIIHTNTTVEMKRRPRRQCERICTRVVQFFDFVNNLQFQFILILEIKGFMVPDFWKFSESQPPVLTFERKKFSATTKPMVLALWKYSKNVAVLMKELAKNQQFRVGFLTWFFVHRTRLRVKNSSMIFENWHPRVRTGSFDCLRATSWGFVYTTLTHWLFLWKGRDLPNTVLYPKLCRFEKWGKKEKVQKSNKIKIKCNNLIAYYIWSFYVKYYSMLGVEENGLFLKRHLKPFKILM
jgi:hypothetical protein